MQELGCQDRGSRKQRQQAVDQVKHQVESLFEATEQTTKQRHEGSRSASRRAQETGKRLEFLLREVSVLNSMYEGLEKRQGEPSTKRR